MRYAPDQIETVAIKQCHTCAAELLERDKFCRRCGIRQAPAEHTTKLLSPSFSGSLVKAVAQSVAQQTAGPHANRVTRRLVALLVTLPLWLMIVLLSPLDAYLAAQAASQSYLVERDA
jgi:hypothetical protein